MSHTKSRTCFAPGCVSGYRTCTEQVSLFQVPKNIKIQKKWSAMIPRADRELQATDVLCEKHFNPEDIITSVCINNINIPYKRPRLKNGAVPIFFPNCPAYLNKNITQKIIMNRPELNQVDNEATQGSCLSNAPPTTIVEPQIDFFLKVYLKEEILLLTEHWGFFATEENEIKYILFSQMFVQKNKPIVGKCVIISEHLDIKYFFGNNQLTLNISSLIKCKDDIEKNINKFSEVMCCPGGPSSEAYKDVANVTECAYLDYSSTTWRHKMCTISFDLESAGQNSKLCKKCDTLWSRFDRNVRNKNIIRKRVRNKGFGLKSAEKVLRKSSVRNYKLSYNCNKLESKIQILNNKIKMLEDKFKTISEADFNERLENIQLPMEQKFL